MSETKSAAVHTRSEAVVDVLHGVPVPDPYRWLEDGEAEEVKRWTEAQNRVTEDAVSRLPGRQALQGRLKGLFDAGALGMPIAKGRGKDKVLFYTRREGAQNQPVLYVRGQQDGKDAAQERPLLDVNQLSSDGTRALDWWVPSEDGALLAYGLSEDGSEQSVLHVRDVKTGKDLPDEIPNTRAAAIAWLPDGRSFYYTRYPAAGTVPEGQEPYHRAVFLHELGHDPKHDARIFPAKQSERDMTDWPSVAVTPNGRYVAISVSQGWSKTELFLLDRQQPQKGVVPLVTGVEALYSFAELENDRFYVLTNEGAPRYRLFEVDPAKPARQHWKEVLPQTGETLESVTVTAQGLVVQTLADASSRLRLHSRAGKLERDIPLPALGTVGAVSGRPEDATFYFSFSSFVTPTTIFAMDGGRQASVWGQVKMPIDPGNFVVGQDFFTSKDGTRVPLFLVHHKNAPPDGRNAALLYGYGGFNISLSPWFNAYAVPLLESGAVFALANLRGGGEYGEDWHKAGMQSRKQNVFDDVIAAAQHLIDQKLVARDRLAIEGRSNGGLLVGAAITQRPDLFRAAISGVPLLDMIRYPKFRIAKLWIPEYGDPEKPDDFAWLLAYSPYHRVQPGTAYPATMFVTAASDSRVDPMHARKMVARMQAAQAGERPIYLRLESQAGHGAGKPVHKVLAQYVDELAFLFAELNLPLPPSSP